MEAGKAVLVVGAGDATGGAIARRFARDGFIACATRRQADKLAPLVERIRAEGGQARGVFGAPTCFVGEQMFFGQDRLDFVREALAGFQS